MFEQLTYLKNKIDKANFDGIIINSEKELSDYVKHSTIDMTDMFKPLEDVFSYIKDDQAREDVINFVELSRVYYNAPYLNLEQILVLYNTEMNIKAKEVMEGTNLVDYFNQDEVISWIAAKVFDEDHFGSAITELELIYRNGLLEEYKDEIMMAKIIIGCNPNFELMTYQNKINYVANLIVQLKKQNTQNKMPVKGEN